MSALCPHKKHKNRENKNYNIKFLKQKEKSKDFYVSKNTPLSKKMLREFTHLITLKLISDNSSYQLPEE